MKVEEYLINFGDSNRKIRLESKKIHFFNNFLKIIFSSFIVYQNILYKIMKSIL